MVQHSFHHSELPSALLRRAPSSDIFVPSGTAWESSPPPSRSPNPHPLPPPVDAPESREASPYQGPPLSRLNCDGSLAPESRSKFAQPLPSATGSWPGPPRWSSTPCADQPTSPWRREPTPDLRAGLAVARCGGGEVGGGPAGGEGRSRPARPCSCRTRPNALCGAVLTSDRCSAWCLPRRAGEDSCVAHS